MFTEFKYNYQSINRTDAKNDFHVFHFLNLFQFDDSICFLHIVEMSAFLLVKCTPPPPGQWLDYLWTSQI